jgi:hypothetical protein
MSLIGFIDWLEKFEEECPVFQKIESAFVPLHGVKT